MSSSFCNTIDTCFVKDDPPFVHYILRRRLLFSSLGFDYFILWKDLMQNHVHDNQTQFDMELSACPLKRKLNASNVLNKMSANIQVKIEDVSKLNDHIASFQVVLSVRHSQYFGFRRQSTIYHLNATFIKLIFPRVRYSPSNAGICSVNHSSRNQWQCVKVVQCTMQSLNRLIFIDPIYF